MIKNHINENHIIIIMPIVNFYDHYRTAKSHVLEAIQHNKNIVLWGSGCNGKTHLINELADCNLLSNYTCLLPEDPYPNTNIESNKPFCIECNDISYPTSKLKNNSYVMINMNGFIYPKYSRLRSGKDYSHL